MVKDLVLFLLFSSVVSAVADYTNTFGEVFVWKNPHQYYHGSTSGRVSALPVNTVYLTVGFYIGKTEVTQGFYTKVMGHKCPGIQCPSSTYGSSDTDPMYYLSYEHALAFITKLNALESTTAYRLPTEYEWEVSCRYLALEGFGAGGVREMTSTYLGAYTLSEVRVDDPIGLVTGTYRVVRDLGSLDKAGSGDHCGDREGITDKDFNTSYTGFRLIYQP